MGSKRKTRKRKAETPESSKSSQDQSASTSNPGQDAPVPAKEMKIDVVEMLPTRCSIKETISAFLESNALLVLKGPIGCGKTSLVREIAQSRDLPLRIIQMGDQLDSKILFGSYHCTEIPGDFVWKPSNFTKYLREDCVILLEDLDCALADLISAVITLCEKRKQVLPSGESIRIRSQTKIIATVRTSKDKKALSADFNGTPCHVELPPFSDDELRRIICVKFPRLVSISKKLVAIFTLLKTKAAEDRKSTKRQLTSTDLFRACARLQQTSELTSNINVITELIDLWVMHPSSKEMTQTLASTIAEMLNVTTDELDFVLKKRQPEVSVTRESLACGRSTLEKRSLSSTDRNLHFGVTRDVCQLMERIAFSVQHNEPVLLSGETGVGKTTVVQTLANYLNAKLHVVNLSQHSDSSDLIGGFKPVSVYTLLRPLRDTYNELFDKCFDRKKNAKFFEHLDTCLSSGRYVDFVKLIGETARRALDKKETDERLHEWAEVLVRANRFNQTLLTRALPFAYVRGVVAEAAEKGDWLLIDEVNLAPAECLDAIVQTLDDVDKTRHPDFRLFACMNPATDTGKRNLPIGVRARFAEYFVHETTDPEQLVIIIRTYLPTLDLPKLQLILKLFLDLCKLVPKKYSLRTLCRALSFAADNIFGSENRSLYEAFQMSFVTDLDAENTVKVEKVIQKSLGKVQKNKLPCPVSETKNYMEVEGYWIEQGPLVPSHDAKYVLTPSVKKKLAQLARVVCSGRYPVLLEGETSAGKTSMVTYLAQFTGNRVVRINNHEHTDLQEYIGSYSPDNEGKLQFSEGALLKAVRNGDWVILDELNLAPTDVIEALNRLLDDNRELFVSELNVAVKAHRSFRLFATQNPAGAYAGRKKLSRALLNRFVLLRFDHLPFSELTNMVCVRCAVAPSSASKMIAVLGDLRNQRSLMGVFSARDGLMTLRDVFRWAGRLAVSEGGDWQQILADQGYMLLASRCRNEADEKSVKEALEKHLKRTINPKELFAMESPYMPKVVADVQKDFIVWTYSMRRMAVLCYQAWLCDEPILMVGETGCGKTTVAQKISKGDYLFINCHERTETADLLGRLRPNPNGTFEWKDGVVVEAMKVGKPLLIDEISLAADSVLERLNPLLESFRSLYLTDAGTSAEAVESAKGFQVVATMNPGGDYGKKELSKALRNRFTEFWCTANLTRGDWAQIILKRIRTSPNVDNEAVAFAIEEFIEYFTETFSQYFRRGISIRDVVALVEVFNSCVKRQIKQGISLFHAFHAILFDSIPMMQPRMDFDKDEVIKSSIEMLTTILRQKQLMEAEEEAPLFTDISVASDPHHLCVSEFKISYGPEPAKMPSKFSFDAPTCRMNLFRLARALSIDKPILLEGAPGCGKSSTIAALASSTGNKLVRLNLSDQTDVNDLFGSDVPVVLEDGGISFRWQDGPVLQAIKEGCWILLDEMNLASQSVLEGLNSCFDHRKQLYIAELNRTFDIDTRKCRFFACQNPRSQGGNRRALPKSFVNRFVSIYTDELTESDERLILEKAFPEIPAERAALMVEINQKIRAAMDSGWHMNGAPFEFNLRDLIRWAEIVLKTSDLCLGFSLLYLDRMRSREDKAKMSEIFRSVFGSDVTGPIVSISVSSDKLVIGPTVISRVAASEPGPSHKLLPCQMSLLLKLALCSDMNWLSLLVGPFNAGKRSVIENLASLTGNKLYHMRLTSETDALELLGTYEQITDFVDLERIRAEVVKLINGFVCDSLVSDVRSADDILKLRTSVACASLLVGDEKKKARLEDLLEVLSSNCMRFEWFNSKFLDAYINGEWIIIEDVNCCSAAVLDRLNTCLESNGELTLSERGGMSSQSITAHPNFRVFFTMDPARGSISRAMRNRSVEISVGPRWMQVAGDLANVISSDLSISTCELLVKAVENREISSGEVLALSSLVKSSGSLESALRRFNRDELKELISNVEAVTEFSGKQGLLAPLVDANLVSSISAWKLDAWLNECPENAHVWAFLLAVFASSPTEIFSEQFAERFSSNLDSDFIKSVLSILKTSLGNDTEELPWDGRLLSHHSSVGIDGAERNKLITRITCLWFLRGLKSLEVQNKSPLNLSLAYVNKRLRVDQLESPVLKTLYPLFSEVATAFKADFFQSMSEINVDDLLKGFWNFAIFAQCASQPSDSRSGLVLLQLAWQYLKGNFLNIQFPSTTLMKHLNTIGSGWTLKSEKDLKRYTKFYENWPLAVPFQDADSWNMTNDAIQSIYVEDARMEVEPNEEDVPDMNTPSVFDSTLKALNGLAVAMGLINNRSPAKFTEAIKKSMISNMESLNALTTFNWSSEKAEKLIFHLTYLNSSFAVSEFDEHLRNVNMIGSGLLTEVMENLLFAFNFDTNIRSISLQNLNTFTSDLARVKSIIWRLLPHLENFDDQSKSKLNECVQYCADVVLPNSEITGSVEVALKWVDVGFDLLQHATPAANMVDPLIKGEQNQRYLEMRLELIEAQLGILKRFKRTVSCDDMEGQNLRNSSHPWLASLVALEDETLEVLEECRQKSASNVHRPEYSAFGRLTNELVSFRQMAMDWKERTLSRAQSGSDWRYWSTQDLDIYCSQLCSFQVSSRTFIKRLVTEFSAFPDVIHSFIASINLIMVAVNYQLKEARLIGTCRAQAALECVPQSIRITDSSYGKVPKIEDLFSWAISTKSTMPMTLQQRIIRRLLADGHFQKAYSWITVWWKRWYDGHVEKKEKMFVYRKKAGGTGEDGEEVVDDEDEIMMQELFPKFDEEDEDSMDVDKITNPLRDDDLFEIVTSLHEKQNFADSEMYLPLMWLLRKASAKSVMSIEYGNVLKPFHLDHLTDISAYGSRSSVELNKKSRKHVIDVYHENDSAEILRAVDAVRGLEILVRARLDEWPEVAALRAILASIFRFLAQPSTLPLLQLASHVERILMEAEHWEKVAHRGNTLEEGLSPLRKILVDWRKMEVVCWDNILNKVESDSSQIALLLAYPLAEALYDEGNEDQPHKRPEDILAMMIEWIQNSTLIDFAARLQSIRIVAACAKSSPNCHVIVADSKFPDKVESIVRHFEQYGAVIRSHLEAAKSPIEKQLKDFVRIVQFKDLNLANVRASAQKAHRQLFALVKSYKSCGNEPAAPFFDQIPKITTVLDAVPLPLPKIDPATCNYATRMVDMCREIADKMEQSVDSDRMDEVMQSIVEYDSMVRTQVAYDGDDEEKEKQQGRAVNKRQQGFAYLIRELGSVGVKGRRCLTINGEQLSAQSVVEVPLNMELTVDKLFRQASSARSTLLKLSHKPHQQLSVSVIKHITGISEFLLKWLFNASLQTVHISEIAKSIGSIVGFARNHLKNAKRGIKAVNYNSIKSCMNEILSVLTEIADILKCCQKIVAAAPESTEVDDSVFNQIWSQSELLSSSLNFLSKQHAEYGTIVAELKRVADVITSMTEKINKHTTVPELLFSVDLEELSSDLEIMSENFPTVEGISECLEQWLPKESLILKEKAAVLGSLLEYRNFSERFANPDLEAVKIDFHPMLLAAQALYKGIVTNAEKYAEVDAIDSAKAICELFVQAKLDEVAQNATKACSQLAWGAPCADDFNLNEFVEICVKLQEMCSVIGKRFDRFVCGTNVLYLHFESVGAQLLEKGYVNPIPKIDNQAEGGRQGQGNEEGTGMGDGQGENDVTDELDNMGQIEGLQGENEKEGEKPNFEHDKEHVEMDDDFAADLEDIDADDNDKDDDDNNDGDDNEEVDWNMGDVDDSQENELDPDVWDKPQEEKDKETDEGTDAANEKNDELAAANDEDSAPQGKDDKERAEAEGEENEDIVEGDKDTEEAEDGGEENHKENVDERDLENEAQPEPEPANAGETGETEDAEEPEADDINLEDSMDGKDGDDGDEMDEDTDDEEMNASDTEQTGNTAEEEEEEKDQTDDATENIENYGGEGIANEEEQQANAENVPQEDQNVDKNENDCNAVGNDEGGQENEKHVQDKKEEEVVENKEDENNANDEEEHRPKKKLAEEMNSEVSHGEIVKEQEDDQAKDKPKHEDDPLAPIREEENVALEKQVVDSASLEEAQASRAVDQEKMTHRDTRKNTENPLKDREANEEEADSEEMEVDGEAEQINLQELNRTEIHTNTSIYDLVANAQPVEPVVMDEGEDSSETDPDSKQARERRWGQISNSVSILSAELAENLRLIIEPSIANKLEGDYKSGKRLNMRRLISYIASDYRKNSIWLRRTKKAQRNYQIMIAVDDSKSMSDNQMTEMTCQTVCLIEQALRQLEIGELAMCKFGESVKMLRDFGEFHDDTFGARLLKELGFDQKKTNLADLLAASAAVLEKGREEKGGSANQMMIIVSDGHGVLADGGNKVRAAVQNLFHADVTVLFVIVDNINNSVTKSTICSFNAENKPEIVPYMSKFPFPFYVLVRHINVLSAVIADAIRQWFELTVGSEA